MGLFSRFYKGPAKPFPQDDREGDDDWQAGDIAECIGRGNWFRGGYRDWPTTGPRKGQRFKVAKVQLIPVDLTGEMGLCLSFMAFPGKPFDATAFRKVRPQADEETACEAEFAQLVKRAPQIAPTPSRPFEEAA